ncbi:hypothetical protein AVEN_17232-1 [Araneus ventricosus]|uniref:Uncharacterized protein n=1 Tax=Araneus ventricosus TaxID=182803 RepID=A0A4Y2FNP6_ARAVE|nr:hypothetical protein AVEN_17232-1 [Araneus ventricosus]
MEMIPNESRSDLHPSSAPFFLPPQNHHENFRAFSAFSLSGEGHPFSFEAKHSRFPIPSPIKKLFRPPLHPQSVFLLLMFQPNPFWSTSCKEGTSKYLPPNGMRFGVKD